MAERERGRVIMFPRRNLAESAHKPRSNARPNGLADGERRCSPAEVLQVMMQVEDARQKLAAHAGELSRLADQSALASRRLQNGHQLNMTAMLRRGLQPAVLEMIELANLLGFRGHLADLEREWIWRLQSTGERLLNKLDAITDLQDLHAGELTLQPYEFSLDDLLGQCCHMVAPEVERKQVALTVAQAEDVPLWLCGDGERLGQIVLVLLENALRSCSAPSDFGRAAQTRGTIELGVQLVPSNPERCMLLFTVTDNSPGMSKEEADDLLQTGTANPHHPGLVLARRLAELMDGGMGVRSEPGSGTEFWFTVQLSSVAAEAALHGGELALAEPVA